MPSTHTGDHFGDFNEMILDAVAAVETRQLGFLDDGLEIAIIAQPSKNRHRRSRPHSRRRTRLLAATNRISKGSV